MLTLIVGQEPCGNPTETDVGSRVNAVAFLMDGQHLLSGGPEGIRMFQVEDGKRITTMKTRGGVVCLAVSNDGRYIAGGTNLGHVVVWDIGTETLKKVIEHKEDSWNVNAVDFSPNSPRIISASGNKSASIWDTAARQRVLVLPHEDKVFAARYSPLGDRIATATRHSVRVYDASDGRRIFKSNIITLTPCFNTGLLWSNLNNHEFLVVSDGKITKIYASTALQVSEWVVPATNTSSCFSRPKNGEFIVYSTSRTVIFWDTGPYTQLDCIQHSQDIQLIAVSSDDLFLAIGKKDGKIVISNLPPTKNVSSTGALLDHGLLNNSIANSC